MLGRNKNVAREEYLAAKNEKEPADFEVKETTLYLSDVTSDANGVIHLGMSKPGFLEIESFCQDAFISFDKKVINTDDFTDEGYVFLFTVKAKKLHNGKNFARITFRTPRKSVHVDVIVHNNIYVSFANGSSKDIRVKLCRDYIDLRTGKLFQTEWQEKTEALLASVSGNDAGELYLILYRANVLIAAGRYEEAKNLIEFTASQMSKLTEKNWELVSYYLYVNSMYEMDDDSTAAAVQHIRRIYEEHPSWPVLWTLFYMDSSLGESPAEMMKYMEGEYLINGCTSPVMYFEAAECLKHEPELLAELTDFSVQALNFAAKEDFLNINIVLRFAELVWDADEAQLKKKSLDAVIRILKNGYEKFESNLALKALCKAIILKGDRSEKNHKYFAKAIREFLETKDIYSYFIYTADHSKMAELPPAVLEYFIGRETTLGDEREYFFACIVSGKKIWIDFYKKYLSTIIRFAAENVKAGRISDSLAVIYREIMEGDSLSHDLYRQMLEIICTREISLDNPLIASALVFHRELGEFQEVFLKNGKGQVRIYSPDALILFKDMTGNLYGSIEYKLRDYLPKAEFIDTCIEYAPISRYMLMGGQIQLLRAIKQPETVLEYLFRQMGSGQLRSDYEQELLKDMIIYFSRQNKDDGVSDRLLYFLDFELDPTTRGKLIEVLIDRRLFKEAYSQIEKYGFDDVDVKSVTEMVHVLAEVTDFENDALMCEMAAESFMKDDYDPIVFRYLDENYEGSIDVLVKMYFAASAYGHDDGKINERIVKRMLEEGCFIPEGKTVFTKYFVNGEDGELKDRFLIRAADSFLYSNNRDVTYIFPFLEKRLLEKAVFPDRTVISFILYERKIMTIEDRTLRLLENLIEHLVRKGIMLEEFKDLKKRVNLPPVLMNTYIAGTFASGEEQDESRHITRENMFEGVPKISFEITGRPQVSSGVEAMKEIFEDCYVKNFTLFFGEKLKYRIEDGPEVNVSYNDLNAVHDGSRYSDIDNIIRLTEEDMNDKAERALMEYYVKNTIVEKLF